MYFSVCTQGCLAAIGAFRAFGTKCSSFDNRETIDRHLAILHSCPESESWQRAPPPSLPNWATSVGRNLLLAAVVVVDGGGGGVLLQSCRLFDATPKTVRFAHRRLPQSQSSIFRATGVQFTIRGKSHAVHGAKVAFERF